MLRHRGPDGHGTEAVETAVFGAERLRVIDPSPAGDQPFTDPSGQILLVLNGAIYNAPDLRARYATFPFRSRSDVETVLPLYLDRGCAGIEELDGMFALAIYDGRKQELILGRDRAGEKPLFYRSFQNEVWFASEVQALLDATTCHHTLDTAAIGEFLVLGYVPEPRTMFADIRKVEAGTLKVMSPRGQSTKEYWNPDSETHDKKYPSQPIDDLESLLTRSVAKQLTADVPIGIFTSGGVDSSLLAALAVHLVGPERVRTFSVGFADRAYDESRHAQAVARYLGTRHESVRTDERSLSESLRTVVDRIAEPIADPAVLPTYLLARTARDHVTVALSGEGADELFGGYPTYLGHRVAAWYTKSPGWLRGSLRQMVETLPVCHRRKVSLEYLLKRFATAVEEPVYQRHLSWFGTGLGVALTAECRASLEETLPRFPSGGDDVERATLFDYRTYLRDNLLTKVDRATMLSSLEARAPYLDTDVTRFALALDSSLKVRGSTTKWLLKNVARRWLPRTVANRRKGGLSVPIAQWLNGGLREDVDRLLPTARLEHLDLIQPAVIQQLVREHRTGRANHGRAIWTLLMLAYWKERWAAEG
jgi:asparagine synthase (glutamine-hydrolysing)